MFNRVVETNQNDSFSGIENARKYAKEAEKSSKIRFRGFLNKLSALNVKGRYLEVGAGSGTLAAIIAENNEDVDITAVEISSDMVTVANEYLKKRNLESSINFIEGNIEENRLVDKLGKFDLVYSTFSLHHWENPERAIKNLMKYVKKGGVLIIYDLKRVWWLYWIPKKDGFFNSIRASYKSCEIRQMLEAIGINEYKINCSFPFFLQNITIWA